MIVPSRHCPPAQFIPPGQHRLAAVRLAKRGSSRGERKAALQRIAAERALLKSPRAQALVESGGGRCQWSGWSHKNSVKRVNLPRDEGVGFWTVKWQPVQDDLALLTIPLAQR